MEGESPRGSTKARPLDGLFLYPVRNCLNCRIMTVLRDIVEMGPKTLNVNKVSTEFFYWFWGQHGYKHSGMFIEGAPHLIRWAAKGRQLKNNTIRQYRRDAIISQKCYDYEIISRNH